MSPFLMNGVFKNEETFFHFKVLTTLTYLLAGLSLLWGGGERGEGIILFLSKRFGIYTSHTQRGSTLWLLYLLGSVITIINVLYSFHTTKQNQFWI